PDLVSGEGLGARQIEDHQLEWEEPQLDLRAEPAPYDGADTIIAHDEPPLLFEGRSRATPPDPDHTIARPRHIGHLRAPNELDVPGGQRRLEHERARYPRVLRIGRDPGRR